MEEIANVSVNEEMVFCQSDDFLPLDKFMGFQDSGPTKLKTMKYFFPNADQIEVQLNGSFNLLHSVEEEVPVSSKAAIECILEQIYKLSPVEKLLLYLKLPTGKETQDPLKLPINPLGNRVEVAQTIAWIKTHFKEDKHTSIPKQEVYSEYVESCREKKMKPLSTADFGKVMKQVYPVVRPRRLGTRGNSRYCYSGMACRTDLPVPVLPTISLDEGERTCAWAAQVLGTPISNLTELEAHLASRGLPASSRPVVNEGLNRNDTVYCMSSKIAKTERKNTPNEIGKRKAEDGLNSKDKVLSEKDKKKSSGKTYGEIVNNESEITENPAFRKLKAISKPLLPAIRKATKGTLTKTDSLLESSNSLELEEEIARFFNDSVDENAKKSQLRLLLEEKKKESLGKTSRRVSFENATASPKGKFNFVPISPVSPVPKHQKLNRSCSVSSTTIKVPKAEDTISEPIERCQSVPMIIPQVTPMPSEFSDFGIDPEPSNLLLTNETSNTLLIEPTISNDNFSTLFSIMNDMDNRPVSNVTDNMQSTLVPDNVQNTLITDNMQNTTARMHSTPSSSFFGVLDCDETLNDLVVEGSDVL